MIKSMKFVSSYLLLLLFGCVSKVDRLGLPPTWTDDLAISVYNGDGMLYQSLEVTYTADKCQYDSLNQGKHEIHDFPLSAHDKQTIIKQLHEYDLGSVWSTPTKGIVHDKATQRICVTQKSTQYCAASSASQSIGSNGDGFFKSYNYLVDFARKRQASSAK